MLRKQRKTNNAQKLLKNPNPKLSEFNSDLCKTLLSVNIPLNKLKKH